MSSKPANQKRSSNMFVYGEGIQEPYQQSSMAHCEEPGWGVQPPIMNQYQTVQQNDNRVSGVFFDQPVQCFNGNYYVSRVQNIPRPQYQPQPHSSGQYLPHRYPIFPNLPCQQTQEWNHESMCYNVDGAPCQYTKMVDLEDFMNNEKRKEKSRVAARCRRTKEMQIFAELTAALPAKKEEVEQLDKASVMRLAISYLRARDVASLLPKSEMTAPSISSPKGLEEVSSELSYMKALDGFVLVLSQQGDIVYCSENIADHLGISQMEIMGQSVFELSHPCDHEEIREALRSQKRGRRDLLLRLKCTLTGKGRSVHLKSASYKVIHVTGHMLFPSEEKPKSSEENNNAESEKEDDDKKSKFGSLVAIGRPIPHPSNIEIPLDSKTFLSKHSLDMKFTYTDESLLNTFGFEPEELVGRSLYDYHHAADSASLAPHFKSLFSKGQCETGQYRFLAKSGGYAWVQTQATLITDKQQKPISIVCVNYVISGIECKDEVFAAHQVQHADLKPVVPAPEPVPIAPKPTELPNGAIVGVIVPQQKGPTAVTDQIFAPRQKGMSKGFLMLSQDEGRPTMLKDEPDDLDLTHLAPTAGDACIPLENTPFELFDEFILSDNYCSLLGDDLASGSPVDSLTADSLLMSSPEPQENDSSCERSSLLTELSLDAFDSGRSDENDIEEGHSPYIPAADELPVLEPVSGLVMWGALPDSVSQARPQPSETQNCSPAPALQRLLVAPPTGPPPQDLITNIYSDQGLIPNRSLPTWDTGVKRVLKQEEEPTAKRVKRSPTPALPPQEPAPIKQSSSVLMNLLDLPPQLITQQVHYRTHPQYQAVLNTQRLLQQCLPKHIPSVSNIQQLPNKQVLRTQSPIVNNQMLHSNISNEISKLTNNAMSPLSLNISSPMYSLPSSPNTPNYSPAMSPAPRDRILSPYSTPQSLSPVGYSQPSSRTMSPIGVIQGGDPYLSNKMQPSPSFSLQGDLLLDSSIPLASSDFWSDEMMQTSDLLSAFDDVKLG